MTNHMNFKITVDGNIAIANPQAEPKFGKIIRITDVPDGTDAALVARQVRRCVFVGDGPNIIPWSKISAAAQGSIIRY